MSKSSLPQSSNQVSADDLTPEVRARLEYAKEIAEAARRKYCRGRRRWSEEGALCATLVVLGVREALLKPALENHAYAHRLYRKFPCSPRCLACDLWALLWQAIQATTPARDWPVRRLLADLIEEVTGYRIVTASDFADQVARDLKKLPDSFAAPPRRRTAPQKRLTATYNVTVDLWRGLVAPAEEAQRGPDHPS